jgi:hypothetical protein
MRFSQGVPLSDPGPMTHRRSDALYATSPGGPTARAVVVT